MDGTTVVQYRYILAFLALGLVFGALTLLLPHFLAPRRRGADALKIYESGIIPERGAWKQFSLSYYIFALLYLAIAVDVIYLFPVAVVYRLFGTWQVAVEMLAFIGLIALAFVYAWRTGAFTWE
jgi:NADH:ubiquinone oxidoreductase subunit 3 (subunit A)